MNAEEKKQTRIGRYNALAEQAAQRATAAFERSDSAIAGIPFGQPILVGHHSEKRHRAAIAQSHAAMDRMVAENEKADYYRHKAKAAENNDAIYTDDDNAVQKLEQKIATLEALQERMKAANKIVKSTKLTDSQKIGRLIEELDATPEEAAELLVPDCFGKVGFSSCTLTNNNATIRTAKQRLERVRYLKAQTDREYEVNGIRVMENYTDNRFQIFFDDKPDKSIRVKLHEAGYRWCRTGGCWQCYLKRYAIERGKTILESMPQNSGNTLQTAAE